MTKLQNKVFSLRVSTKGQLLSNFVFENTNAVKSWLEQDFNGLVKKYGKLGLSVEALPSLKVGDTCFVYGEGSDEFVINDVVQYSKDRYGFVLNVGWTEEVAKCHTNEKPKLSKDVKELFSPTSLKKMKIPTDTVVSFQ